MANPPRRKLLDGRFTLLFALGIPALVFFTRLAASGIWDPFELNVADLARRVAIHAFGAQHLALAGSDNAMPHLGDLGKNELPFDSIAIGFKLFGLHEWSGRLPLAVWALAGTGALYAMLRRLMDRKAGLYGALVLATMPLYFIQARTMLGDIVTMAATSIAFAGLAIATFDEAGPDEDEAKVARGRVVALVVGLIGLAAGFLSRGLLIGVAIPGLGVGLAWGVTWSSSKREVRPFGDLSGALALLAGVVAAFLGTRALFRATATDYSMLVGAQISIQSKLPTFDFVIHYLGHALFPWSAFIPLAVGRLFRQPTFSADPATSGGPRVVEARETHLRLVLLVGAAVAFGVYAMMAPRTGHLAFGAPALLAGIAAVTIRDFERGAPASRAVAVGVALLTLLFLRDYDMFPEKGLSAYAVATTAFPDSFKKEATTLILLSSAIFVFVTFFSWIEREERKFNLEDYKAWPRALSKAWEGNLLFGLIVVEAALCGIAAIVYAGLHWFHWKQIATLGVPARILFLNAFWAAPALVVGGVWGVMGLRDLFRFVFRETGITRGFATTIAGVAVGAVLSFSYYPALAAQLSPKDVFDAYAKMHKANEPLALLGVGGRSASYYSEGEVKAFTDVPSAYGWLMEPGGRRWLAVRNEDLGKLNSMWRSRPGTKTNLPVLDAKSSQILLVSNELAPGETNQSPYDAFVLNEAPHPTVPLSNNLQDMLECVGWDVADSDGQPVSFVIPAKHYHFRIYYKVLANVTGEWETFIHIDGYRRRFNGDHKTLGGKYPFSLWQPGDYIVDDYDFALEPNFTPGNYTVFFGLFVGDTRMKVKSGRADDNRIDGGFIRVQ